MICFVTHPLAGTLLARWEVGYREGWVVLTDLAPETAEVAWYGLRAWIEDGFKDSKRGGWQWQYTRMSDPARIQRFWLVLALATLWVVSVGSAAEDALPVSHLETLSPTHVARRTTQRRASAPPARLLSCFRRGITAILVALLAGRPLPQGTFSPEPWPTAAPSGHPPPFQ